MLRKGDGLVVLAEDDDTYEAAETAFAVDQRKAPDVQASVSEPEEIMFCGWRRDMQDTITVWRPTFSLPPSLPPRPGPSPFRSFSGLHPLPHSVLLLSSLLVVGLLASRLLAV